MTENIPTMEDTAENILNEREVLNVFDKIIVGEYEIFRSLEDENGLYILEVRTTDEGGDIVQYNYVRKNSDPKDSSTETVIYVVFYMGDIPCGGHPVHKNKEGVWVPVPYTNMPPNTQELITTTIDTQSTADHSSNTNTQEQLEKNRVFIETKIKDIGEWSFDSFKDISDSERELLKASAVFQSALEQAMTKVLSYGGFNDFQQLIALKLHNVELLKASPVFQSALKQVMTKMLSDGFIDIFLKLVARELPTPETPQSTLEQGMTKLLSDGNIDIFLKLVARELHNVELLKASPVFQSALEQRMTKVLSNVDIDAFQKLIALELHNVELLKASPVFQSALEQAMTKVLSSGKIDRFQKLVALKLYARDISELPNLQSILEQGMTKLLSDGNIDTFQKLIALELHNVELLKASAVFQSALEQAMTKVLSSGKIDRFQQLVALKLYQDNAQDIINTFLQQADSQLMLTTLEKYVPGFTAKAHTSMATLGGFCGLKNSFSIEQVEQTFSQNPFLAYALEHPYGSRLIGKYPTFDTLSKNNIREIFTQSEYAHDNTEHRLHVQDKLRTYERNNEILDAIQQKGIPTDTWLNWDKETVFTLGTKENKATTLYLKNPVSRIQESFTHIFTEVNNVVQKYRSELINTRISEDVSLLQEQLTKMESELMQATETGDTKKQVGITKGITSLRARIESPKMIVAMDTVKGIQAQITRLVDDIANAQKALQEVEALPVTDAKSRFEKKKRTKETEQKIQELTQKLALRYRTFFTSMEGVLVKALGEERGQGVIQQVRTSVGEALSHTDTDLAEFERIFTPQEKTTSLDGRSMRIRLASRAPQDLYIGNYTNCCVAIDNDHHKDKSPISDYLTDLGMQIAIIEDEEGGMPVAAAWLFIGTDGNEEALVVDNIEGNTSYTQAYTTQLQEKFRAYLAEYANALKLPLSQGTEYNHLVVAHTVNGKYVKVGGANRADGIFLEAEGRG